MAAQVRDRRKALSLGLALGTLQRILRPWQNRPTAFLCPGAPTRCPAVMSSGTPTGQLLWRVHSMTPLLSMRRLRHDDKLATVAAPCRFPTDE
jgi:hypothetical protein